MAFKVIGLWYFFILQHKLPNDMQVVAPTHTQNIMYRCLN